MTVDKVYVYFRYDDQEKVMVIINNNEKEQTFELGRFAESLEGVSTGTDVISGKEISISAQNKITVSGNSSLILDLQ